MRPCLKGNGSMPCNIKNNKAFTLLEVIVSVAILSIIVNITLIQTNNMFNFIEKQQLKTQCREILQCILTEKHQSLIDGSKKQIFFFSDRIYITTIKNTSTTEKITLDKGISLYSNTYNGGCLELKSIGTVNKGGRVTFQCEGGYKMTIVVQPVTGRIYLEVDGDEVM